MRYSKRATRETGDFLWRAGLTPSQVETLNYAYDLAKVGNTGSTVTELCYEL